MDIVAKKQLNILIQLAQVDNHFAKEELDLICQIAKQHQFTEETVQELIDNPEPIASLGALSTNQRFHYLINCIELAHADHKLHGNEIIFSERIAIRLGFKKDVVSYLLPSFHQISKEELKKVIFEHYDTV